MRFKTGDRVHVLRLNNEKADFYGTLQTLASDGKVFSLINCTDEEMNGVRIFGDSHDSFGFLSRDYYSLVDGENEETKELNKETREPFNMIETMLYVTNYLYNDRELDNWLESIYTDGDGKCIRFNGTKVILERDGEFYRVRFAELSQAYSDVSLEKCLVQVKEALTNRMIVIGDKVTRRGEYTGNGHSEGTVIHQMGAFNILSANNSLVYGTPLTYTELIREWRIESK